MGKENSWAFLMGWYKKLLLFLEKMGMDVVL